jgi:hypothetical protein
MGGEDPSHYLTGALGPGGHVTPGGRPDRARPLGARRGRTRLSREDALHRLHQRRGPAERGFGVGRGNAAAVVQSTVLHPEQPVECGGQFAPERSPYAALTAETSLVSESLASPKSMVVLGSYRRSLSMPAKPGRIDRFRNTMLCAWSTFRIGMP